MALLAPPHLDYAILVSVPDYLLPQLQSVMNAAARLIVGCRRSDHITGTPRSLHGRRAPERVTYKVTVLTHKATTACVVWRRTTRRRICTGSPASLRVIV